MGSRGPVPKRESERKRRNEPERPIRRGVALECVVPEPSSEWADVARMLWDSLEGSGQSRFYQASDWAAAYFMCETVTAYIAQGFRNGHLLAAINSMMTELLVTEGARRRAGVELALPSEDDSFGVIEEMKVWQERLNV